MDVKREGEYLVIRLPIFDPPTTSRSGRSLLVGTTAGVHRTTVMINDEPVRIVANAFIYGEPPIRWEKIPGLGGPDDED